MIDDIESHNCDFSGYPLGDFSKLGPECLSYIDEMMTTFTGINIYNIYGKCWDFKPKTTNFTAADVRAKLYGKIELDGVDHEYRKFYTPEEYTPWLKGLLKGGNIDDPDYGILPCIYAMPAAEHLNSLPVRAQLKVTNS